MQQKGSDQVHESIRNQVGIQRVKGIESGAKKETPKGIKALGAHFFTVEKFTANGEHEKFKSWLNSHGNEKVYPDRSSRQLACMLF
jgi:hypothetical protein